MTKDEKEQRRRRIRVCLVGCGIVARYHVKAYIAASKLTDVHFRFIISTLVDVSQEIAEKFRVELLQNEEMKQFLDDEVKVFTSLTTALSSSSSSSFDVIDIMIPHDLHEIVGIEAIKSSKHVLIEKPLSTDLESCKRILSLVKEQRKKERERRAEEGNNKEEVKVFLIGENSQYWPEILMAQDLIRAGAIGDIITARAFYREAMADSPFVPMDTNDDGEGTVRSEIFRKLLGWRASEKRSGGGVVIDGGQHWIRPLRIWFGDIQEVVAVTSRPLESMEAESLCHALLRFGSPSSSPSLSSPPPFFATLECTMLSDTRLSPNALPQFLITGTKGEIEISGALESDEGFGAFITLFNRNQFKAGIDPFSPDFEQHLISVTSSDSSPASSSSSSYSRHWESNFPLSAWKTRVEEIGRARGYVASFIGEMKAFGNAITEGTTLPVDDYFSLGELETTMALYQSARTHSWEKVNQLE